MTSSCETGAFIASFMAAAASTSCLIDRMVHCYKISNCVLFGLFTLASMPSSARTSSSDCFLLLFFFTVVFVMVTSSSSSKMTGSEDDDEVDSSLGRFWFCGLPSLGSASIVAVAAYYYHFVRTVRGRWLSHKQRGCRPPNVYV